MSRLSVSLNFSHFAVWTTVGKGCAVWGLFGLSISELESGTDISYLPVAQNVEMVQGAVHGMVSASRTPEGLRRRPRRNRPEMIKTHRGDLKRWGDESQRDPLT